VQDVYRAVETARAAGFDNLNLDFIFGLPNQEPARFARTLEAALALAPEHLSLYSLIVEENTPLYHWVESGRVQPPDDDLAADLYELTMARLGEAGYAHYEVSNWARRLPDEPANAILPQRASRHNLLYWLNGEYLGVGPGAHSHLRMGPQRQSRRWGNRKPVPGYVNRLRRGQSVEVFAEEIETRTAMGETMMVGLRLVRHGVPHAHFAALFGVDPRTIFADEINGLVEQGLLTCTDERLVLTAQGLLLGNQVFARFLPEPTAEAPTASALNGAAPSADAAPSALAPLAS
jgi:oxygen-independent coproporphyrinogen-3 oxidase